MCLSPGKGTHTASQPLRHLLSMGVRVWEVPGNVDLRRVLRKPGNGQGDLHLSAMEKPEEMRPFRTVSQTHTQAASSPREHSHEAYPQWCFPSADHSRHLAHSSHVPWFCGLSPSLSSALRSGSQAPLTPSGSGQEAAVTSPPAAWNNLESEPD